MAQIIKHRRGSISQLKDVTAKVGELVMATGSISDLNGPFIFIGETENAAGGYRAVSKLYSGNAAPTISNVAYGTVLDGTPFYAAGNETLYILSSGGNTALDLTGNIEGNTISGVTINNLESTNVTASFFTGSFVGDGAGLINIPASGITNLDLSRIVSGSATASISPDFGLQVNTTISTTDDLNVSGTLHVGNGTDSQIYYDGKLYLQDSTNGVQMSGGNNSYITANSNGYAALYSYQGGTDITADGGGNLWLWAEGGGNTNVASYDGGVVNLNTDSTTGDVHILNGGGNILKVYGDISQTGSLFTSKIVGTGSLFLQPNDEDSRLFEIYNTTPSDIHIHGINGISYFGNDTNYLRLDDGSGNATIIGDNSVNISSNVGSVYISSFDGSTLELNTDGGEGNVNIGNYSNSIYGYTNTTNFTATNYAQLEASSSYVWVENLGAHLHNDSGSAGVGFTARPNGIIEATGSLTISGDTQINGNTSVTGALVVSNGSATFDQGLVAQNSNMLLTSGSSLIVQNNGNVQTDYLRGATQEYNYLSLNGNGVNGQDGVELSSTGDISLWAEGGTVNVTGSLRVTGDIIFSGSINLGDYSGDTVNFNGEISSSIIPQTGSSFDLGSSGQTWNNVWAENAHFTNISLNSIAFDGLTEGRSVFVGASGSLVDYSGYTFDSGSGYLTVPIVQATNSGNGTNFLIGDDMWLGDVNEANATRFMGSFDNEVAKVYLGSNSTNNYLEANYGDVTLDANDSLYLKSQNSSVRIESYDGQIRLNQDSGNNIRMYGNTYMYNNLYVDMIWDESNSNNYLQLHGSNTDDGYWWESGNGSDTTLLNNENNNNLNILQTNSGNVNIDATNGSVNIHSQNGMNITGSLTVSDGAGVFNSSLIANNSNLTLDNGSNIEMNAGHVYFNEGCGDIYYNTGNDRLSIYNDCGGINLGSNTYTSNNMYFEDGNTLYTNNISGYELGNLNLQAEGGIYLYSDDDRLIQLHVNNDESGNNYFKVHQEGVEFSTYDFTSDLTHKVFLDNTGSLKLENVSLALTGSLGLSGSLDVYGPTHIHNDLYVSGNLSILGSGSVVHISASQVDIGTNIINLNTYAPFERFAGLAVYDSGSNAGVTGSLLWDSQNDVWIYANPSGSNYASARLISGPLNTGSLGDETGLTNGHFPIATGDDHISDSLLTYQGTTLALNTNKFTVDSSSGDTLIHGNFTIEGVGGVDNGDYSSYIVFRNDENVLGFVDTTDTGNVTDRLLGYNSSTGVLEFSSLIDGGTY